MADDGRGGAEDDQYSEKWVKYYSSNHQILLVGEGDFSFSLSLAKSFGSASNIVASSLDPYDKLIKKYKNAKSNLEILENLGASLLHGLDATKMKLHTDLRMLKFDRVIFNFPHAGFYGKEDENRLIEKHKELVSGFFYNARGMLVADGEIHINHKTTAPFCHWNLQELAVWNSLTLIECTDFRIEDYPGYSNKRGAGSRWDDSFPLGDCRTFKFILDPAAKKFKVGNSDLAQGKSQALQLIPIHMQRQPISLNMQPEISSLGCISNMPDYAALPDYAGLALHNNPRSECLRIFKEYLRHASETFGRNDYDVASNVRNALRLSYVRYMAEDSGRSLGGYINILQELHQLSILRSRWLQEMLAAVRHPQP